MSLLNKTAQAAAMALVCALTACGGGGGSDAPAYPEANRLQLVNATSDIAAATYTVDVAQGGVEDDFVAMATNEATGEFAVGAMVESTSVFAIYYDDESGEYACASRGAVQKYPDDLQGVPVCNGKAAFDKDARTFKFDGVVLQDDTDASKKVTLRGHLTYTL